MATKTALFLLLLVATALRAVAHPAPQSCASRNALWAILREETAEMRATGINDAFVKCVHARMHPSQQRWGKCVSKVAYHHALHAARNHCAGAHHTEPEWARRAVSEFLTLHRRLGVSESVLCCVHTRIRKHLATPKSQAQHNIWMHLHAILARCVET